MRGRPGFAHLKQAYRSGLEATICAALATAGVSYKYESFKVPFTQPAKARTYTPDVYLANGIICEVKGLFVAEDRQKHLWVKEQHPELDIRFVFSRSKAPISKGSKTTYASWCDRQGFKYADKVIPQEWVDEPVDPARVAAVTALLGE